MTDEVTAAAVYTLILRQSIITGKGKTGSVLICEIRYDSIMKKVMMIFNTNENIDAINYLNRHLKSIFEEYIHIENVYLDHIGQGEKLEADAYLLISEDKLQLLKDNIADYSKILIMNRSINKSSLDKITEIPDGEKVLVLNDSLTSSLQTTYNLYELGFVNLTLVPFDENEPLSVYADIKTAITPNEAHLAPPSIEKIYNIGYRDFSFDTLLRLMQLLDLENNRIYKNLLLRINTVSEANSSFYAKYLQEFLKNQALSMTSGSSDSALILSDIDGLVIYADEKAKKLFDIRAIGDSIDDVISLSDLKEGDYIQTEISIGEQLYSVDKSPIKLLGESVGYSFAFQPTGNELHSSRNGLYAKYSFNDIIHRSPKMKSLIDMAKDISKTDFTISITGESGTGKEMFAQSIHNYSLRKDGPFVAINCAALSDSLLDSELFGYEKGSFTGADSKGKSGLFEQAHGGTIFLDEIGDISPNMQLRLLRTLQEKQIIKVGGTKPINVDVRIISATNKNLEGEVRRGNFRSDLFYRLNVIPLEIPPLRERREDILPLFRHFVEQKFSDLTEREKKLLTAYQWPGNIRQLENVATYYKALSVLPNLNTEKNEARETAPSGESLKNTVLKIISANTFPYHGIGRTAITRQLREMSVYISEGKLRDILNELKEKELVIIQRGRSGCLITEEGLNFLKKHK